MMSVPPSYMGLVQAKLMLCLVVSTTLGAEGGPGVSVEFQKRGAYIKQKRKLFKISSFGFEESQRLLFFCPHPPR